MKNFFKRTWHGIPMGLILTFVLVGVVAAASFTFVGGTVKLEVEEPCTFQTYDGSNWVDRGEGFTITLSNAYPGETVGIPMRIVNDSSADLTVTGVYSLTGYPTDGWAKVNDGGGFSGGIICTHETTTRDDLTLTVTNDAPPGTYTFTVNFNRS